MKKTAAFFIAIVMMLSAASFMTVSVGAATTLYWPVPGHTKFTDKHSDKNNAIDIYDKSIAGSPVIAAIGGTVLEVYSCSGNHLGSYGDCNGNGNGLLILGDDGRYYIYAHMQSGSIPSDVCHGAHVPAAKQIGCVGNTGNASAYNMHFQIFNSLTTQNEGPNPANEAYIYTEEPGTSILTISGVRYPTYKKSGRPFEVFGVISSPNLITSGEAVVWSVSGQHMFGIGTYAEAGRHTFNMHDLDNDMRFDLLPDGQYTYVVRATDSKGYEVYMEFPFTVGPDQTVAAVAPNVTGKHNCTAFDEWDGGVVTKAPTCTESGTKIYTCTVCGAKKTRDLAATGHALEYVEAKSPTPESDGNIAHYKCKDCGKLFADANGEKELTPEDVVRRGLLGDVNEDGSVDAKDIITVMKALLGQKPVPYNEAMADCAKDGNIDAKDVIAIMKIIMQK